MDSSVQSDTVFALSAFGVNVAVRVNESQALPTIAPYLPIGWKPAATKPDSRTYSIELAASTDRAHEHSLYCDDRKIFRCSEKELLFERFESDIAIHVANMARHRTFVHAGVVGWCGRAIVIPGRSFSGKTTLVSELLRAGAQYYSDEYALFDRFGRIHPYPRYLHMRLHGDLRQVRRAPTSFGCETGVRPIPLGLVLVTRYRPGAKFRPRQISAGSGVLELLNNTVSARRAPQKALHNLGTALSQATVLRGLRGEAAGVARHLLSLVAERCN